MESNERTLFLTCRTIVCVIAIAWAPACASPASKGDGGDNATTNNANNQNNGTNGSTNAGNNLPPGACPGATPIPEGKKTCRTQEDCDGASLCEYEDHGSGCGALMVPPRECETDEECPETDVCREYQCAGACCEGSGTECVAACTEGSCDEGLTCGEDGHCRPTSCEDGYTCPDGFVCDPDRESANADGHGCTAETCRTDGAACPERMHCDDGANGNPHGQCVADICETDDDCPLNQYCEGSTSPFDGGCRIKECTTDGDCDCGACIQQRCQPRVFVCASPPAA